MVQLNQMDHDGTGEPDIEHVIETWLKQQTRFDLPGETQTVIYPLTFTHHSAAAPAELPGAAARNGDGTLLGLLVAEAPDAEFAPPMGFSDPPGFPEPLPVPNPAFSQLSGAAHAKVMHCASASSAHQGLHA